MTNITIENIMDLMINSSYALQVCVSGRTYQFDDDQIPEELLYMEVESIDDPSYTNYAPLCINLSEDNFDDFDAFEEEYKDYLV